MGNLNEIATIIGAILGILGNIPLVIDIVRGEKGYSFASFGLWSILDFITARNIYLEGGDYTLALVWGITSGAMALLLLIKEKVSWSWIETLVLILITITLALWYVYGSYVALVASITSLIIASIPQIKDSFVSPSRKVGRVYIIFTLAAVVSCFSAVEISFAALSFPVVASLLCLIILMFSYKKPKINIES